MKLEIGANTRVVDLAHPLTKGMPNFPSAPEYQMIPNYRLGDFELADGYWGCNEFVSMSGHSGTHLDALGHVAKDGLLFDGTPADQAQDGVNGLVVGSIHQVAPIVKRGVFIDVPALHDGAPLGGGVAVTVADLERFESTSRVRIDSGDCVIIRTGWGLLWNEPHRYLGEESGAPGIDIEAAHWLGDRGVFLVGADTGTVEVTSPHGLVLPVHMEMLARRGIHLLESMNLEALAETGVTEFAFFCSPLAMVGASGSPVRPVAVLP
ncbi:cyclase family protein [Lysinimonas soli]|uniref:Cyclase family protein n=1 Tax=Lysinimonas soli TaxID=1074233 RepID=A0ABW0NTN6_9MICO